MNKGISFSRFSELFKKISIPAILIVIVLVWIGQGALAIAVAILAGAIIIWPILKYFVESMMIWHIGSPLQDKLHRTIYISDVVKWTRIILIVLVIVAIGYVVLH